MEDQFKLAGKIYRSRLIVGTGKYKDFHETQKAIEASGAEIVTVAVRQPHRSRLAALVIDSEASRREAAVHFWAAALGRARQPRNRRLWIQWKPKHCGRTQRR